MRIFTPATLYEHLLATCTDAELDQMEEWLEAVLGEFHG